MSTRAAIGFKLLNKQQQQNLCYNVVEVATIASSHCTQEWLPGNIGVLQSDEAIYGSTSSAVSTTSAETMIFHDSLPSEIVQLGTLAEGNYDQDADSVAGLAGFLSRPVRIASINWAQGGAFSSTILPWSDYFNTPQIKNKLENYGKIKCKLHLKFLVNGSPFHYGAVRACYFPLSGPRSTFVSVGDLIPFSQTPGVWIEPAIMDTAEMILPFLWQHNWLEITDLDQFKSMGTLYLAEYADLQSANGATSAVTISVYAWAEDVTVMGPTTIGALQSDEYEDKGGTISGPATTIAKIAGKLTDAPVIGPFARATEMGASMVSGVARLFGYSNPPMIDDVMPYQPKSFHAFANSETRMPIDKLCLDPKNEVTVSSAVAGVTEKDPLVFKELLGRESFMLGTDWTGALAVDALLWSAIVNPHYAYSSGGYRTMPPMTYFSPNFRFWRGSIVYKFKFIKTRFHRGRVLISYDPNGDMTGTADTETTTFSRIVDLEHEDEVEFVVPYKATQPLARVVDFATYPNTISSDLVPAYTYSGETYNGTITMRVQTALTGPTTSSSITILSFVKAGEDFVFAGPRQLLTSYSTRDPAGVIQSNEVITQDNTELDVHVGMITTGETIASMRPLLHRTHYQTIQYCGVGPSGTLGMYLTKNNYHRVPPGYGRDITTSAYNNANTAAPYPFNWCQNNPIDWSLDCFVGYRGSMNLHVNPVPGRNNAQGFDHLSASRWYNAVRDGTIGNWNGTNINLTTVGTATAAALQRTSNNMPLYSGGGVSLTNPTTQSALSVNLPQYWPLRFYQAYHTVRDVDAKTTNKIYDHFTVRTKFSVQEPPATAVDWPAIETFYSAGVDFSPVFFLCTPRVFVTTSVPTASD